MLKVMERKLVRKALEMIRKLADEEDESEEEDDDESEDEGANEEEDKKKKEKKDKYSEFWKEFGKNIKLGIIEDSANRQKLAKLSRWYTSYNVNELTSFDQYIERAKAGQDNIYVIAGESKENLMLHPTI